MPAYPCVKCGYSVDTSGDGVCKNCRETRPFKCSKCDRTMDLFNVHAPEKLTFRKPIFCRQCGPSTESVDCRQCGLSLTRSNSQEVQIGGQPAYYHPECYEKQAGTYRTVRPLAIGAGVLVCGYVGYMLSHLWIVALGAALLGIVVGAAVARPFAPR